MNIIEPSFKVMTKIDRSAILQLIEECGRTCYKSEAKITDDSASNFVRGLIKRNHTAMIEHFSISVKFICDRGVSHEIVRHRIASFAQESTRYCNYIKEDFGTEITVIKPLFFDEGTYGYDVWYNACRSAEDAYFDLLNYGCTPEQARSVLPNSLKTEIVVTMNLREWRHFFNLRALGTTGKPHPQMKEIALPLLNHFKTILPEVFEDLEVTE